MYVLRSKPNERVPILIGNTLLKDLGTIIDVSRNMIVFARLQGDHPRKSVTNKKGHLMFDMVNYLMGYDPMGPRIQIEANDACTMTWCDMLPSSSIMLHQESEAEQL